MDLSGDNVRQLAEADRRKVDPPIEVETAMLSIAGQLDWWVKDQQEWWGRLRGADNRQRWMRAVDFISRAARSMTCRCHSSLVDGPVTRPGELMPRIRSARSSWPERARVTRLGIEMVSPPAPVTGASVV
jgi:hypothetical protein